MATRRTTMRSRAGTKLYAVRDESGKFKDIQTYKRAHAADTRQQSKAEIEAARSPIEKKVREAAEGAVKSVTSSWTGAVAAVRKAAKRAVKRVSGPSQAGTKAVQKVVKKAAKMVPAAGGKTAPRKPASRRTATATPRKPAAKSRVRKPAKKS